MSVSPRARYFEITTGQGSIRPVFGFKICENVKTFIVLEFNSQYKDIVHKNMFKILLCIRYWHGKGSN